MVQCSRVMESKVEPWWSLVESVEPIRALVECNTVQ